MSNTIGGTVFVGVNDQREVVGRRRDQGTDDTVHKAARAARGIGRYRIGSAVVDGRPIVVIDIDARPDEVAQTSDGRVLVRRGGHSVAAYGSDLINLVTSRALRRFEHADSDVSLSDVDTAAAETLAQAFGWSDPATTSDRWREHHLLHPSGHLTIAGALTLTVPSRTLGAAKFVIDLRSYESDDSTSYVRRETKEGPVQDQVAAATDRVLRDVGTDLVVAGAFRHDLPRPPRVVREAVANAVAHRDYARDTAPIVIEIRPNGVHVSSPGGLPPPVTVETLLESQSPRNHTIIAVLRRLKLAEHSGQGIDVMQDQMRLDMLHEPVFTETNDSFSVHLPLGGIVSADERGWLAEFERQDAIGPEDRSLLLVALREGHITNSRAREALGGADSVQARSRLGRLRDLGLLIQHGKRGRASYTLGRIGPEQSLETIVLEAAKIAPLTNRPSCSTT
jgi:ATP-dependent DNA helicase RecG